MRGRKYNEHKQGVKNIYALLFSLPFLTSRAHCSPVKMYKDILLPETLLKFVNKFQNTLFEGDAVKSEALLYLMLQNVLFDMFRSF